jgi:hypothetical protein
MTPHGAPISEVDAGAIRHLRRQPRRVARADVTRTRNAVGASGPDGTATKSTLSSSFAAVRGSPGGDARLHAVAIAESVSRRPASGTAGGQTCECLSGALTTPIATPRDGRASESLPQLLPRPTCRPQVHSPRQALILGPSLLAAPHVECPICDLRHVDVRRPNSSRCRIRAAALLNPGWTTVTRSSGRRLRTTS